MVVRGRRRRPRTFPEGCTIRTRHTGMSPHFLLTTRGTFEPGLVVPFHAKLGVYVETLGELGTIVAFR